MLSELDREPVLIWVAVVAAAMSAMVASSVSPERCDTTAAYLALNAMSMAAKVSVRVPIWLGLTRMALAIFLAMPSAKILVLVTNTSSPTSWILLPNLRARMAQPSQSPSLMPSSMLTMGYFATNPAR